MKIKILSCIYVSFRLVITKCLYAFQYIFFKNRNLEPAVIIGDKVLGLFNVFGRYIYDFNIPRNINVEVYDLKFPSPLVAASFKSEINILEMWLRMGIGGTIFKTILKTPLNMGFSFI